jgi:hypothetical protein
MQRHVREIKKEVESLVSSGEIEDFSIITASNKPHVGFRYRGKWHSINFSSSPRTAYTNNFVRQQIRRRIRDQNP